MNVALARKPRTILASIGIIAALCLAVLLGSPGTASASESPYCGNQTLGAWGICTGGQRTVNALYGWGDQHSVCVLYGATEGPGGFSQACSGGGGQGVYDPLGSTGYLYPKISNNSGGANTVHGVAFAP
jgi:hypothetical protein